MEEEKEEHDENAIPPQPFHTHTPNTKYKTILCKHFLESGQCHMGLKCHFAHGNTELRNPHAPQPNTGYSNYYAKPHYSNYKSIPCKYYQSNQNCKFGNSCTFAHGKEDLRNPGESLPQYDMDMYEMYAPQMAADVANPNYSYYPMNMAYIPSPVGYHHGDDNAANVITEITKKDFIPMVYPQGY